MQIGNVIVLRNCLENYRMRCSTGLWLLLLSAIWPRHKGRLRMPEKCEPLLPSWKRWSGPASLFGGDEQQAVALFENAVTQVTK